MRTHHFGLVTIQGLETHHLYFDTIRRMERAAENDDKTAYPLLLAGLTVSACAPKQIAVLDPVEPTQTAATVDSEVPLADPTKRPLAEGETAPLPPEFSPSVHGVSVNGVTIDR